MNQSPIKINKMEITAYNTDSLEDLRKQAKQDYLKLVSAENELLEKYNVHPIFDNFFKKCENESDELLMIQIIEKKKFLDKALENIGNSISNLNAAFLYKPSVD